MRTTKGNCTVIHNEFFTMLHFLKTFPISMEMYNHFSKVLLMMSEYFQYANISVESSEGFRVF
jgi:hypothetical protein